MTATVFDTLVSIQTTIVTGIIAFFIPLDLARIVAPHTIQSALKDKGFLKKRTGIAMIMIGFVISAIIWTLLQNWLTDRYGTDVWRLFLGYAAIMPLLYIAIRILAGYGFSWLSGFVHIVGAFFCLNLFAYSLGYDVVQFYATMLSQSHNATSGVSSP